jgi:hypothetical protein
MLHSKCTGGYHHRSVHNNYSSTLQLYFILQQTVQMQTVVHSKMLQTSITNMLQILVVTHLAEVSIEASG